MFTPNNYGRNEKDASANVCTIFEHCFVDFKMKVYLRWAIFFDCLNFKPLNLLLVFDGDFCCFLWRWWWYSTFRSPSISRSVHKVNMKYEMHYRQITFALCACKNENEIGKFLSNDLIWKWHYFCFGIPFLSNIYLHNGNMLLKHNSVSKHVK